MALVSIEEVAVRDNCEICGELVFNGRVSRLTIAGMITIDTPLDVSLTPETTDTPNSHTHISTRFNLIPVT